MPPNTPTISVLLAVYNGEKYLRGAIDSVLNQTFRDFEFIIIDDGSKDGTLAILRDYEKKDSRIRLVSRPNKGLTNTLNEGLDLVRGEFIARMDADDLCLPQRFEKQIAYLRANLDCVLLGTRVTLVDSDGMPIKPGAMETTHEEIDAAHLNRGWPVVHPTVMMRIDAVRKVGGYRDQYNTLEDLDLFLRLGEVGKLANLPEVLLHYRQHFASVTHSKEAKQMELRQAIYDETYQRRGLGDKAPPPPPVARQTERTRDEQHVLWAWSAILSGNLRTARKHAWQAIKLAPTKSTNWKALACAVRGR